MDYLALVRLMDRIAERLATEEEAGAMDRENSAIPAEEVVTHD
jgi:hypothetical protein